MAMNALLTGLPRLRSSQRMAVDALVHSLPLWPACHLETLLIQIWSSAPLLCVHNVGGRYEPAPSDKSDGRDDAHLRQVMLRLLQLQQAGRSQLLLLTRSQGAACPPLQLQLPARSRHLDLLPDLPCHQCACACRRPLLRYLPSKAPTKLMYPRLEGTGQPRTNKNDKRNFYLRMIFYRYSF